MMLCVEKRVKLDSFISERYNLLPENIQALILHAYVLGANDILNDCNNDCNQEEKQCEM